MTTIETEFEKLVSDFENLATSNNGGKATKRESAKVEKMLASIVETGMTGYSAEFADCRDIGHRWEEKYSNWEENQLVRLCLCDRCGSERYEFFSRTGRMISRRYNYSDGYLLADEEIREIGGHLKRYWRAVNVQRAISGA